MSTAAVVSSVSAKKSRSADVEQSKSMLAWFLSTMVTIALCVAALGVIAAFAGSAMGWYRLDIVLSGSMKPVYNPGDLVYAVQEPTNTLATGDVLLFKTPATYGSETVTHRVVSVSMSHSGVVTVRTKGDNNRVVDPWTARIPTKSVWVVKRGIPMVGFVAVWAKSWWPLLLSLVLALPMLGFARDRIRDAYRPAGALVAAAAADVSEPAAEPVTEPVREPIAEPLPERVVAYVPKHALPVTAPETSPVAVLPVAAAHAALDADVPEEVGVSA